jgi:hypothetical protein
MAQALFANMHTPSVKKNVILGILGQSNSNSLANQLGIHIIFGKTRKIGLKQFGKPTWQK